PLPTPPRPAEALALPSLHQMAPDLLLHPVLNEAEALAGISNREVIHPAAQYRVDQLDHPICGLGSVAAEYVLERPQQCRSFLELRRDIAHARHPVDSGCGGSRTPDNRSFRRGLDPRSDSSLHLPRPVERPIPPEAVSQPPTEASHVAGGRRSRSPGRQRIAHIRSQCTCRGVLPPSPARACDPPR